MLLITRKRGESLVLTLPDGREVRVTYRGWRRGHGWQGAKQCVDAERSIPVLRAELLGRAEAPAAPGGLRVGLPRASK